MTVCSFTPSRIGIISTRRSKSKSAVAGSNFSGVSLTNPGYFGACAGSGDAETRTARKNKGRRMRVFMREGYPARARIATPGPWRRGRPSRGRLRGRRAFDGDKLIFGMQTNALIKRFPGVIGFPVTPFNEEDQLDEKALRKGLEYMAGTGLAAVCCCGSNGEMPSITLEEYRRVADIAADVIGAKKGLILGVGQTLRMAQDMARTARNAGAEAILLVSPYSNDLSERGLADYYRRVAGVAEIPVFLYQTKWSGVLPLSLLDRLTDVENIQMVKDENGNLSHYLNVRREFGERFYWVNGMAEPFVPSYWHLGVQTFTSGLACFMAEKTLEIGKLAQAGDFVGLNKMLDQVVTPLYEIRGRKPGYKCSMIKTAMTLCGIEGGYVRSPLIEMDDEDKRDLEALLERVGLRKPAAAAV